MKSNLNFKNGIWNCFLFSIQGCRCISFGCIRFRAFGFFIYEYAAAGNANILFSDDGLNIAMRFYTSIDSMPKWAQAITKANPVSYFIDVMLMVVLKGSSLWDIKNHLLTMAGSAILLIGWTIINYRKRS